MRTHAGAAAQDSDRLAADRAWVRWGMAAAVTGMLAWVIAVALIPPDAKLANGEQHLDQVLRAHTGQGYAAALLTVLGTVLLAAFFAVLTRLVPEGSPGGRSGRPKHLNRNPASARSLGLVAAAR